MIWEAMNAFPNFFINLKIFIMCMKVVQRLRIDKFDSKTKKRFIRFTLENLKASKKQILGKQSILDAMDDALKRNKIQWTSATITAAYALWKKYFAEPLVKAGAMAEQVPGKKGVSLKAPYTFILDEGELINVFYPPTKEEKVEKPDETEPVASVEETPSPVVEEESAEEEKANDNTDATPQKQEEVSEEEVVKEALDEMIKKADVLVYILEKVDEKKEDKTVSFPIGKMAEIFGINEEDPKAIKGKVYRALIDLKEWSEQFEIFLATVMRNLEGKEDKQKNVIRFANDRRRIPSLLAKARQLKKKLEEKLAGEEKPVEKNNALTTAPIAETTTQKTSSPNMGITIEVIDDLKSAKPLAETIKEEGVSCSFKDNFVFISPEESRNFLIKLGWEIRILQFIKNLKYSK